MPAKRRTNNCRFAILCPRPAKLASRFTLCHVFSSLHESGIFATISTLKFDTVSGSQLGFI
jgi:hypothetical protein